MTMNTANTVTANKFMKSKCTILIVNEMVYLFYIIMTVLSILSWNVRGVISSSLGMNNLLDGHKCDILVSSVLRLSERYSIIWNSLHPMYKLCVTHSIMLYIYIFFNSSLTEIYRGSRGCDRMVVGLPTTYVISAYHH